MESSGDALDNAVTKRLLATLQTELLDCQKWTGRAELRLAIFDFTEVSHNCQRRHPTLGYLSPAEFKRRWLTSRPENDKL